MTNISEMKRLLAQQGHTEDSLLVIDVTDLEQAQFPEDQSRAHTNLGDSLKRHGLLDVSSIRSIYSALKPANISASTSTMKDPRALPSDPPGTMYPPEGLTKCPVPNGKRFKVRWSRTGDWTCGETAPMWSWGAPDIAAYVIIDEITPVSAPNPRKDMPSDYTPWGGSQPDCPVPTGAKFLVWFQNNHDVRNGKEEHTAPYWGWGYSKGSTFPANIIGYKITQAAPAPILEPGWIEHKGGMAKRPPVGTKVNVRRGNGIIERGLTVGNFSESCDTSWMGKEDGSTNSANIVAYQIVADAPSTDVWKDLPSGYTKWEGKSSTCPIPHGKKFKAWMKDSHMSGHEYTSPDFDWLWSNPIIDCDVIGYQLIEDAPTLDPGWIKHDGDYSKQPPHGTIVNVKRYSRADKCQNLTVGDSSDHCDSYWRWSKDSEYEGNIIAYQIIQPNAENPWITHDGKGKPVPDGTIVNVRRSKTTEDCDKITVGKVTHQCELSWRWYDANSVGRNIIAYQVVTPK